MAFLQEPQNESEENRRTGPHVLMKQFKCTRGTYRLSEFVHLFGKKDSHGREHGIGRPIDTDHPGADSQ